MNKTLSDYFTASARKVLGMLLAEEPGISIHPAKDIRVEDFDVAVSVEVIGEVRGQIAMLLSLDTIERVADVLLKDLPEELRPSLKEHCVREVVNMVTGDACTSLMNDDIEASPGVPIYYPRKNELEAILSDGELTKVMFSSSRGEIQFLVATPVPKDEVAFSGEKTIMLVDDSIFILKLLRMVLEGAGYTIVGEAKDGDEALSLYKKIKPSLVIMDITMPHMNGVDAVSAIRQIDNKARIMVCSAVANSKLIRRALQEGVVEFLPKPFDKEQVIQSVEQAYRATLH